MASKTIAVPLPCSSPTRVECSMEELSGNTTIIKEAIITSKMKGGVD